LHLVEGMVAMFMLVAAMGFAATALSRRFRLYTVQPRVTAPRTSGGDRAIAIWISKFLGPIILVLGIPRKAT
jgi:hypothetical protein